MRNFLQVAGTVDALPLLHQIAVQPDLWNQNGLRREYPDSPHATVDDIWLRFQDLDVPADQVPDTNESVCYPAWDKLPAAQDIVFALMARVRGVRLGRVIITRLPMGKVIAAHCDGGGVADYYQRYQVCLQATAGNVLCCEDESISMRSGEVWLFNNLLEHEVINNGSDDRIVMIVDIAGAKS